MAGRWTVQLPIFNEVYVVERLLRPVKQIGFSERRLKIQCWTILY